MTARLQATFARARAEGRVALINYLIPGYPSLAEDEELFDALIAGGADIVEIEIPFSDPLADGTTIQKAAFEALANGTTTADCIAFVAQARQRHPDVPIVFMSYLNPVLAYGLEAFAKDAAAAGADAVILVDLPPEEASAARECLKRAGLDLIFLVAPTSSDERIAKIAALASGFIYCVSVAGVTGAREQLPPGVAEFLARVRRCTKLPLALGFGISRREHITSLSGLADAAVVGSGIINVIAASEPQERAKSVREYVEVLSGRRRP